MLHILLGGLQLYLICWLDQFIANERTTGDKGAHIQQKNAKLIFFHLFSLTLATGISYPAKECRVTILSPQWVWHWHLMFSKLPSCHLFSIQWEQKGSLWTSWRSTIWSTRAPLVSWHVLSINAYVIYFWFQIIKKIVSKSSGPKLSRGIDLEFLTLAPFWPKLWPLLPHLGPN